MGHTDGTHDDSQDMAQEHLLKRKNRYSFRRNVPKELQKIIGKTTIKKALGTSDLRVAKTRAALETVRTNELFEEARQKVQLVAPTTERKKIGFQESLILVSRWYNELEEKSEEWMEANLGIFQEPEELQNTLETLDLDERYYSGETNHGPVGKSSLKNLLEKQGLEFSGSDSELLRLSGLVRRACLENVQNDICRLNREPLRHSNHDAQIRIPWRKENSERAQRLGTLADEFPATMGEVLEEFLSEQAEKGRKSSTLRSYTVPLRLLKETLGENGRLADVDRNRMKELKRQILTLPPNVTQRYPNKTLLEAAALAEKAGKPPISPKTAESYFTTVTTFFNFAHRTHCIPRNPGTDVLALNSQQMPRKKRALFEISQLNKLFTSKHYPDREEAPGRFWVPFISLFHSMRLNEACQFYTEDIIENEGVWFFRIDDFRLDNSPCEKSLKTKESRRMVPVHPELQKMGFLDFVKSRKSDSDNPRLFTDLRFCELKGNFSDPFQKGFTRMLVRALGAKPDATFHSLRHMWKDAITDAEVPEYLWKRMGGWKGDASAAAEYGNGPFTQKQLAAISKVAFPGLNLDHFHQPEPA